MVTIEKIENSHTGHVLLRDGKKKYRVVKPRKFLECDDCFKSIDGNAVKFEARGNVTLFTLCPECAVTQIN